MLLHEIRRQPAMTHRRPHTILDGVEGATCPHCETWKPLDGFYTSQRTWDGITSRCRACINNRASRKPYNTPAWFRVIHDPLPYYDGGFAPGAEFPRRDVACMLEQGVISPGALLETPRGQMRVTEQYNAEKRRVKLVLVEAG